ncbi:MAG: hypothetical protein RR585_02540 [Coprobacillus sp.]
MVNRLYEKLKEDQNFQYKLEYNESNNHLIIFFHEYLSLEYFEGNYTSACDEGYMTFTNNKIPQHWHMSSDEEALKYLFEFIKEDIVYIENMSTSLFKWFIIKVMTKKEFEKKKEKYMFRKSIRIYTVDSIIKRDSK